MARFVAALIALVTVAAAHPHNAPHHGHLHKRQAGVIYQCQQGFSLTFDDGPFSYTAGIADNIRNRPNHAQGPHRATFYVNGNNYGCIYDYADLILRLYNEGHQIASHTWGHQDMEVLWSQGRIAEIDEQIQRLDQALVKIIGARPKYFRPPYGSVSEGLATYLRNTHGKVVVKWSGDSLDSAGASTTAIDQWYINLLSGINPNNLTPQFVLNHDPQWTTSQIQGTYTNRIIAKGYRLITTAACMNDVAYDYVGTPGTRDNTWSCTAPYTPGPGIPNNPGPTCQWTYKSILGDTCATIGADYGMTAQQVQASNSFVTCSDIWANTNICITTPAPGCPFTYTSVASDTCTNIGSRANMSVNKVRTLNPGITNCASIPVGTSVCTTTFIPPTNNPGPTCQWTYKSIAGDTCATIGADYGMTAAQVQSSNSFVNCNDIWANTNICITTAPPGCPFTYTSVAGDTCTNIGTRSNTSVNKVRTMNPGITNCASIPVGTSVCTTTSISPNNPNPNPPTCAFNYTSRAGENCAAIETKFGMTSGHLVQLNSFVNCNDIWTGTSLCITETTTPCRQSITTPTATTCAAFGNRSDVGLDAHIVQRWNSFVNCADIWAGTSLCIRH